MARLLSRLLRNPGESSAVVFNRWEKRFATGFSLVLLGAVVSPLVQNWRAAPVDSFPLSYYPMFSARRGKTVEVTHVIGLDASGHRYHLPHGFAGTVGGMNQGRRQIRALVTQGQADGLCVAATTKLAASGNARYQPIETVQVVTGTYRLRDCMAGNHVPKSERVHASLQVARGPR